MPKNPKTMIVMPSNNTGFECGRLFGMFPDRLAHLHSCERLAEPKRNIPWALDNGVFGAFTSGREWSEEPFYSFLDAYSSWKPIWAVVPDWVGDKERTLILWEKHSPALKAFGVPLAFAAQDGMTPDDVPMDAEIVFVGGSTSWKWKSLSIWTKNFPRVHVGRVNSRRLLEMAEENGAESCDGTGWFRDPKRTQELEDYLKSTKQQPQLAL
jgi:hypothetical protein